ncbi:MAG TPA: hypothetical protein VMY41_10305 [Thermohalobaculum sp.]|nr:hypothetical protein [Thermohalobaculum sp.]
MADIRAAARSILVTAIVLLPIAARAEFQAHQFPFQLEPGHSAQEFALCEDGASVISGGFIIDHSGSFPDGFTRMGSVVATASSPAGSNGWMAQIVNISKDLQNGVLHILISCEEN